MLLAQNMIKKYACLPRSLTAAQHLQSLVLASSRMAPRLLVTNQAKQHKYIQAKNGNKLK